MRIHASHLISYLPANLPIEVRTAEFAGFDPAMPYTDVLALVVQGRVEGVATSAGRLKYLRLLPEAEWPAPRPIEPPAAKESNSTAIARTNLGVYLQEIEAAVMDPWGMKTRIIIGHTYALCLLRGAGM